MQARYDAAGGMLVDALALVRRDGDAADRARVDQLLVAHTAYLSQRGARAIRAAPVQPDPGVLPEQLRGRQPDQ